MAVKRPIRAYVRRSAVVMSVPVCDELRDSPCETIAAGPAKTSATVNSTDLCRAHSCSVASTSSERFLGRDRSISALTSVPPRSRRGPVPSRRHAVPSGSSRLQGYGLDRRGRERQLVAVGLDDDPVAVRDPALEQRERERVLEPPLHDALQRPGAERRVVALAAEQVAGL